MTLNMRMLTAAGLLLLCHAGTQAAPSQAANSASSGASSVVTRVEGAVKRGASAAERGVKRAANAAERGVTAASGAVARTAKKIGLPASGAASESTPAN
jgi:hypothetical protein